jgi:hypothetical protein
MGPRATLPLEPNVIRMTRDVTGFRGIDPQAKNAVGAFHTDTGERVAVAAEAQAPTPQR